MKNNKFLYSIFLIFALVFNLINNKFHKVNASDNGEQLFSSVDNYSFVISQNDFKVYFEIENEEYTINLDYTYYSYNNEVFNYYLADCLYNPRQNNCLDVVKIMISDNKLHSLNDDYKISVFFHIDNIAKMYLIEHGFSSSNFLNINIQDDVSQNVKNRLEKSFLIPFLYDDYGDLDIRKNQVFSSELEELVINNQNQDIIDPMSSDINLPEVGDNGNLDGICEVLSSTDQYLDSYSMNNNSSRGENFKYKVDDIIEIIPHQLFCNVKKYCHIGNEYGYYINTKKIYSNYYSSQVFLFDIESKIPGFGPSTSTASVEIIPKLQGVYEYFDRSNGPSEFSANIEDGYTYALIPVHSIQSYYLNNVAFYFEINNKNNLNFGDDGYNPHNDNGDYLFQTRYNINGTGDTEENENIISDAFLSLLGFVPYIGEALGINEVLMNIDELLNGDSYFLKRSNFTADNEANISTKYFYIEDQIEYYDNPLKSSLLFLENHNYNSDIIETTNSTPVLIGNVDDNDYVKGSIELISQSSIENSEESNLRTGLAFNIVYDTNSEILFPWLDSGELKVVGSYEKIYDYSEYKIGQTSLDLFSRHNETSVAGEYEYNKFIVPETGLYAIRIIGNSNIFVKLYTHNGVLIYEKPNSSSNVSVTYKLIQGMTYHIVTGFNDDTKSGTYGIIVENAPEDSIILNNPRTIEFNDDYHLFVFYPTITNQYTIQTIGNSNTKIDLYLDDGTLLASNDNYSNNINARINIYLRYGYTYYIKVYISGFTNDGFSYGVTNLIVSPAS